MMKAKKVEERSLKVYAVGFEGEGRVKSPGVKVASGS